MLTTHLQISCKPNEFSKVHVILYNIFITSAKEVMFSPGFVSGFVSFFVNKITQKLMDGF